MHNSHLYQCIVLPEEIHTDLHTKKPAINIFCWSFSKSKLYTSCFMQLSYETCYPNQLDKTLAASFYVLVKNKTNIYLIPPWFPTLLHKMNLIYVNKTSNGMWVLKIGYLKVSSVHNLHYMPHFMVHVRDLSVGSFKIYNYSLL